MTYPSKNASKEAVIKLSVGRNVRGGLLTLFRKPSGRSLPTPAFCKLFLGARVGKSTKIPEETEHCSAVVGAHSSKLHKDDWEEGEILYLLGPFLLFHSAKIFNSAVVVRGKPERKVIQAAVGHGKPVRKAKEPFGKWRAVK